MVELPVMTSDVPVAFVKDSCPTVPAVMMPSVARNICIVELPVTTSDVPVPFVNASCRKVLVEVVVAVKKFARTSPNTSSLESEVVAVAPIKT